MHLTYCISTRYLIRDNVTTNFMFSLVEKRSNSRALCVIVFILPRLQCDASCVGVLSVHFPAGDARARARASPAGKHSSPPPEAGFYEDNAYNLEEG